ncbi:MAG: PAS domain-containing protein [Gammaproteobacteria bacterium]|nr:PAS domain-containing protein [Gammaproteobacteria bacterium]MCP5418379.1 PAS domain-containing protein [Chromatiaceae bacterium]
MRERLQPLLGALIVVLALLFGAHQIQRSALQEQYLLDQSIAEKRLRQVAGALAQSMNLRLSLTNSLAAFVAINREFTQQEFDHYASQLQAGMVGVRSLQLAPDGIVRYLTNLESNRVALGHNLFTDQRLHHVVEQSVRERSFIIHGPYELRQGGVAIVARRPLFFAQPGESGDHFWGFATVIIDIQPILADAGFFGLEKDLDLAIRGTDGRGGKGELFYGQPKVFGSPLAVADVALPDASWQLAAALKPGSEATGFLHSNWYWLSVLIGAMGLAGLIYSIIDRPRQLKKQVYLATENLHITLHSIGDAVIATDRSGGISIMNPVAERLTGWDLESARGRPLSEVLHLVHAATGERISDPVESMCAPGLSVSLDEQIVLIARDGREIRIADSASPMLDNVGKVTGVVLVFRDVTRESAVRAALQESEARYRSLFQNAEVSIWNEDLSAVYQMLRQLRHEGVSDLRRHLDVNPQLAWDLAAMVKVLQVNEATLKMFGAKTPDEFLMEIHHTFAPDTIPVFIDSLCAVWNGEKMFRSNSSFRSLDGRELKAIISFPIPEKPEGFSSVPISILDITEQVRVEQALHRAQKMDAIGQLTGGIAHDFNNILAIVMGNLNLLQRQIASDPKILKRLETIENAAQRAVDLTRQLLSFSRREFARVATVDINQVIAEMVSLISQSLTPEVKLVYRFSQDLWLTRIDPADFEHAVINLIINARDAMAGAGELILETGNVTLDADYCSQHPDSHPGEYVELTISDSGKGIPRDLLDRIFEPFYTTKPQGKGTGLGLSLVFGFVNRSNGYIHVDSEPDVGTRVHLYLPRAQATEAVVSQPDTQVEEVSGGSETLLVVDDEPGLLDLAREMLQSLGYHILTAANAAEALQLLSESPTIDLLFSDLVMPGGMSGYELAAEACKRVPGLKVLLTSGYTERAQRWESSAQAWSCLLKKPYSRSELAGGIRAVLDGGDL